MQADELWSESERIHLRPGHHWVFEFGDAGDGSCVKRRFELAPRSWTEYEGTRYYNGEAALVIKRWFHRADDDASGCTFIEWDSAKATAPGAPPAALLFNSSKLHTTLYPLACCCYLFGNNIANNARYARVY